MTGAELRAIREQLGLTQLAFARQLGMQQLSPLRTYGNWERGVHPIPGVVAKMARTIGAAKP